MKNDDTRSRAKTKKRTNPCEADALRQRTEDIYGEGRRLETQ